MFNCTGWTLTCLLYSFGRRKEGGSHWPGGQMQVVTREQQPETRNTELEAATTTKIRMCCNFCCSYQATNYVHFSRWMHLAYRARGRKCSAGKWVRTITYSSYLKINKWNVVGLKLNIGKSFMLQVANPSMRHLAEQTPCRVAGARSYPPSTHGKIQGCESDRFIKPDLLYSKYIQCSLRATENIPEPVRLSFHCSEM